MTDLHVTARFRRQVQPAPYEAAEADVTVMGLSGDNPEATMARLMNQAQRVVLQTVGRSKEYVEVSGGVRPAAPEGEAARGGPPGPVADTDKGPESEKLIQASTEGKRGPGRPRKEAAEAVKTTAVVPSEGDLDAMLADASKKPEPDAEAMVGVKMEPVVSEKDLPPVTEKELQDACSNAAAAIGAQRVKDLYLRNYKCQRVSEIEPVLRRAFLKDLETRVAEDKAKKKAE